MAAIYRPNVSTGTYRPIVFSYGEDDAGQLGGSRIHLQDEALNELASAGYIVAASMSEKSSGEECTGANKFLDIIQTGLFLIDSRFYTTKLDTSGGWGVVGYKQGGTFAMLGLPSFFALGLNVVVGVAIEQRS